MGPPDDDVIYMSNEGNTFTENWKSSSVVSKAYGKGVTVVDFDRDADLDVYVSNYWLTANYLWRNDGFNGTTGMTRVGGSVANGGHTQGSTVGDFDNDGDFDIYVSNLPMAVILVASSWKTRVQPVVIVLSAAACPASAS